MMNHKDPTRDIIEQTKQLMTIRSTADRPDELRRAVDFVADIVGQHRDITIERFERNGKPSFLAYRKGSRPEKFDVLLNGHVDVVSGEPALFKPYEQNGRLYGRGALDMKGTALTMTDVFCELVGQVPYSLGLQIVSDEELGGYDGVRMHIDDYGVCADFAIMGEYVNHTNTIYNAARGICWTEIAFKGRTAHGGHLWNGSNAVLKAGAFAGAVLKHYPTPDKETWTTTASIADLSAANDSYNKVPDRAVLKIDFRYTQEDPVFRDRASLEAFIHKLDPDAELINVPVFDHAIHVDEHNPYVQGLSHALESVTRKQTRFLGRPAGSDGRHFAMVGNDVVEFGLYGKHSHSENEYVELASFAEYQAVLRNFLRNPIPSHDHQEPASVSKYQEPEEPTHVWYATYSSGLVRDNFLCQILGGTPRESARHLIGCTDKTLPKRDVFITLPYRLYVSGSKNPWDGGGYTNIELTPSHSVHTVARAYLITLEQFREITAEQNGRRRPHELPVQEAMEHGHATIGDGSGRYEELVYCGTREGAPIFSLAATTPETPYAAPTITHTRLLVRGLSENKRLSAKQAIDYIMQTPGFTGNYQKREIEHLYAEVVDSASTHTDNDNTYVWYAAYGSGLAKDNFMRQIEGGEALNQMHTYNGCSDKTPPIRDEFITLPYQLYFAKGCQQCRGHLATTTKPSKIASTVARAYLITVRQFKEIAASLDGHHGTFSLPFATAKKRGHASIRGGNNSYSELVYAGTKDGSPIFTITAPRIQQPYGTPNPSVVSLLCRGLLEQGDLSDEQIIDYVISIPGAAGAYDRRNMEQVLKNAHKEIANSTYVWYASYGAGLPSDNFAKLIQGGQPEGARFPFTGLRDKTLPTRSVFTTIPYELYFAGESARWGGGVALINPTRNPKASTLCRLYLITLGQFKNIHETLTGNPLPAATIKTALRDGLAVAGEGMGIQDGLLFCGIRDGYPVFTLTRPRLHIPYTAPSEAYVRNMLKGIAECDPKDIKQYIKTITHIHGIDQKYKASQISRMLKETSSQAAVQALGPGTDPSDYVWYATYGSGLSRRHFCLTITGEDPYATIRHNEGCSDKTLPIKDEFISLPYQLFFAGTCDVHGGGHGFVDYRRSESAHTISRAYLITREQFVELAAQESMHDTAHELPFERAMQHGHATIGNGSGDYDELVYCGDKEGIPMFTLTTPNPDVAHKPPSEAYTRKVCEGLSEAGHLVDKQGAIEYLLAVPGMQIAYDSNQLSASFSDAVKALQANNDR